MIQSHRFLAPGAKLVLVFLLLLLGMHVHAAGSCYTLEPLKDESGTAQPPDPVCRVLERNLNEFCDEPPLVCGIKIAPTFKGELAVPKWRSVNLNGSLDLVEAVIRGPWLSAPDPSAQQKIWDDKRPKLEQALQAHRLSLSKAKIDLYRIGREIETYRVDPRDCEASNAQQLGSMDRQSWDVQLTPPSIEVIPSPEEVKRLEQKYRALGSLGVAGDVILFQGKPYFYLMHGYREENPDSPARNGIVVNQGVNYVSSAGEPTLFYRRVCEISYRATEGEK